MPEFSALSLSRLGTCDAQLQQLFHEVVRRVDCTILDGHRGERAQNAAFAAGRSKTPFPKSKHNNLPSRAVDVAPYPIEWPDANTMGTERYARALGRWYMFVGYVRAVAFELGIKVRCGADWDGDFELKDQNFHDLPHFELED